MVCVLLILGWRVFSFLFAYIDKKYVIHLVYYVFICIFDFKIKSKKGCILEKFKNKFGFSLDFYYLCPQLLLIVMHWTSIIYEVCGNHIVF